MTVAFGEPAARRPWSRRLSTPPPLREHFEVGSSGFGRLPRGLRTGPHVPGPEAGHEIPVDLNSFPLYLVFLFLGQKTLLFGEASRHMLICIGAV